MSQTSQDVPAFKVSATARELERIRAKRRLLENAARIAPTQAAFGMTKQQQPSIQKADIDPASRNAKIKSSARKLLDQLQAADTSLGDSAHNLKLLFAKQALRALADRQAAVAAEAQQRKIDKLRERLVDEHRRQHQQKQGYAVHAQLQEQQQVLAQAQLVHPPSAAQSTSAAPSPAQIGQMSPTRLERGRSPPSRHRSRSGRDRYRQSPSRRSPSPPAPPLPLEPPRRADDFDSLSGYSHDGDSQRNDAVHVRDTRRLSPSRTRDQRHAAAAAAAGRGARLRGALPWDREHRHAGPSEAGVRGAVSAQALSALLAGLQSHGVNLTSGPPPPPPAAASAAAGPNPAAAAPCAAGGGGAAAKGGDGTAEEHQYVLLPDGTVGLVHAIVKPAVLQPQVTPPGQVTPPPPHAVPLVLLQPGRGGAAGSGGPAVAATITPWPALPHHPSLPYTYGAAAASPPPPLPLYSPSQLGMYGVQYPYSPSLYGIPSHITNSGYPFPVPPPAASCAVSPPSVPPYISPYTAPDGYFHSHRSPQHSQHHVSHQESPTPSTPPAAAAVAPGAAARLHEPHGHSHYRPDGPSHGQTGSGQGHSAAAQHQLGRDVDALGPGTRHSISSLSSDPYGNLGGSVLVGGLTDDGGGGGGGHRGGGGVEMQGSPPPPPAAAAAATAAPHPPSSSSAATMPSSVNEAAQGNVPGGSGVYSGGRYHHSHSHSAAESLRSLQSNGGGSMRGGRPGSAAPSSHLYEATLASPSPRDSLQNLDSPASFRDMPRRTSGSISLSPLRSGTGGGGVSNSIDSGPHFASRTRSGDGGGGASRRRPSPLYVSSAGATGGADPNMPPVGTSGSSASSSQGGSVVVRVTAAGSVSAQVPPGSSGYAGGGGGGDEPSLLLRTLDLGSPSLQRNKQQLSEDQTETPTSRKPSLTSPWSSSGPSDAPTGGGGGGSGISLGVYTSLASGGGGVGTAAAAFPSTRDLLVDVASRPPLYGTSLPYGTAGLYDRYTAGGFYGATGGLYGPSPLYGAPVIGSGSGGGGGSGDGFSGFGIVGAGGSGGGGGGGGGMGARSPSSDSIRSASMGLRTHYGGTPPPTAGGEPAASTAAPSDLMGTSAALALTAAILEGSAASAAASSIISGATAGLSAAAAYGLGQLGYSHLHPTATPSAAYANTANAANTPSGGGASLPQPIASGLGRSASGGGMATTGGSGGGGSSWVPGGGGGALGSGQQGVSVASAANAAVMARLSHGSNLDGTYFPRTRSRVQLMGNDDLADVLAPRTLSQASAGNLQQVAVVTSTGATRLSAAAVKAQQQHLQQQQQGHPSPSRPGSSRAAVSGGNAGAAGAIDVGGLQPMVPTLQLPPRATSRLMFGSAAAQPPPQPSLPSGGGASVPSSETASPTRMEHMGLGDPRDTDAEQSLSARSGRSALSEGPAGGVAVRTGSISSAERVSGVPVVEHRDGGVDAASYAGVIGSQAIDVLAAIGAGNGVGGGPAASAAMPPQQQQPHPGLQPLLELLNNSAFSAMASPPGSGGLSSLGFGGGSTPLERSADSFVRIGSMPISGAASPMATGNPMDFLGSPTKQPQGQGQGTGGTARGSSGGASSGAGGGGGSSIGGGGGSSSGGGGMNGRGAIAAAGTSGLPPLPPAAMAAPPPQPLATSASILPGSSNLQPQAAAAVSGATLGQLPPAQQQQQSQQHPPQQPFLQQQQQHLSGMSFRVSNTDASGNPASPGALGTGSFGASSPTVIAAVAAAPTAAVSTGGPLTGATARTSSSHSLAAPTGSLPSPGGSTRVLSPTVSRGPRPSPAASAALPASATLLRGGSSGFAPTSGGGRAGAPAILSRVLSGPGEFDSDEGESDDGGGGGAGGLSFVASLGRGQGSGLLQHGSGLIGGGGVGVGGLIGSPAGQRTSGLIVSAGRGTLTGGSTAHDDDEFNF